MSAAELANKNAPPIPWTTRNPTSSQAPRVPVLGVRNNITEPTAKMANPRLYIRARPHMSDIRPKVTRRVKLRGRNGSTPKPRKMTGSEIRMIVPLIDAIRAPNVVFERTVHLYSMVTPLRRRTGDDGRPRLYAACRWSSCSPGYEESPVRPLSPFGGVRRPTLLGNVAQNRESSMVTDFIWTA